MADGVIAEDSPEAPDVQALLARHLEFTTATSPPEDMHALGTDGLLDPAVTFFSFRRGGTLLGVGALKQLDGQHAELKSMHTAAAARGAGVGRAMVEHLIGVARGRGYRRLSLETGSMAGFAPARALYASAGFTPCEPFGDYRPSANSTFMTMALGRSGPAGDEPGLPARLSQVLTAFIIECDNEFEHRMPHRTTRHGSSGGLAHPPWLVSMAMWANCLRFVPAGGITAGELAGQARLTGASMQLVLTRMSKWWGYLTVAPGAAAGRVVTPTRAGRQAQAVWAPLAGEVQERWRERFGPAAIDGLRAALEPAVAGRDGRLPDFLPAGEPAPGPGAEDVAGLDLPGLLSKVLLGLALDFEQRSGLALGIYTARGPARLAISANVLRVLDDGGTRVRDLPAATGVAQMTIGNWLGSLAEHRYLTVGPDPAGGRFKVARLTARGADARDAYRAWAAADGGLAGAAALRDALAPLDAAALLAGTAPYPDGWRADVRRPATLPHYPVISPRGGFPDGS